MVGRHTDEEILQDILRDFHPRGDVLKSWQGAFCTSLRDWKARQGAERLRGHCSDDEFEQTVQSITSEPLLEFMVHLAWMLYYRHMPQRGQPLPEKVEDRLVSAHSLWCSIQALHRVTAAMTFFAMPVLLLSVRFSLERLFKNFFPIWFDTAEGVGTLEAMTLTISCLCDPAGYYGWLPALASNRNALHVLQSSRHHRDTHEPPSFHYKARERRPRLGPLAHTRPAHVRPPRVTDPCVFLDPLSPSGHVACAAAGPRRTRELRGPARHGALGRADGEVPGGCARAPGAVGAGRGRALAGETGGAKELSRTCREDAEPRSPSRVVAARMPPPTVVGGCLLLRALPDFCLCVTWRQQALIQHHQGVAERAPGVPRPKVGAGTKDIGWAEARDRAAWLTR